MPDGESTMTFQSEADVLAYLGQQVRRTGVLKRKFKDPSHWTLVDVLWSSTGRIQAKTSSGSQRTGSAISVPEILVKDPRNTNLI